jgi:hypothetical protein
MSKSNNISKTKKPVGRPPTGITPFIGIRLPAELTAKIDAWASKKKIPNRSEAIRRLVELGLKAPKSGG